MTGEEPHAFQLDRRRLAPHLVPHPCAVTDRVHSTENATVFDSNRLRGFTSTTTGPAFVSNRSRECACVPYHRREPRPRRLQPRLVDHMPGLGQRPIGRNTVLANSH